MNELLIERLRGRRRDVLLAGDALALSVSYVGFTFLRYESGPTPSTLRNGLLLALLAVTVQWGLGSTLRIYQGRTTVASLEDTFFLCVVTVGSGLVVTLANLFTDPFLIARSVPPGATFMALFGMVFTRAVWRTYVTHSEIAVPAGARPTLVYGAGEAGRDLVRSMLVSPESDMRPVGLLDDDRWKRRLRVHGIPVLAGRSDLAAVAERTGAELLVIAAPSAGPELARDISPTAREAGLVVKVLPSLDEMLDPRHPSIRDVRDIDVRDLLGRGTVETDVASIVGYVTGKRVLVTGAGGSIGSELCRQLTAFGPEELIMLDRDESALHEVQLSICGRALLDSGEVVLADIRDRVAVDRIFRQRRPQVVFHAAALKHLPMLEQYPAEALKTNVLGTVNVLEASAAVDVERFVNISTDKAADPTSVLGYSKRVAERLTAAVAEGSAGTFLSVRFGNVLASRGSVLRSFAHQIAAGGPVTVTHPEVTRYFMTVQEAVQLVVQAAAVGRDGEVLILDMGEPVRILDVARQLIAQHGQEIDIVFTGLRQGEKLHETLCGTSEIGRRPVHPGVVHVVAPPLDMATVRNTALDLVDSRGPEVIQRLAAWSHDEGTATVPDRQVIPIFR